MHPALETPKAASTPAGPDPEATWTPTVIERPELLAEDVLAVAEGRASAVLVRNYYSPLVCGEIAQRLAEAVDLWTGYPPGIGADHIRTLGSALYGCLGEELSKECVEYFEKAPGRNRALRAAVAPLMFPADRVRIELDNQWPGGATLLRIGGRHAFFGLCRHVSAGGGMEPHTDRADWDLPCEETERFLVQLFINIYLTQAELGGDLELWKMEVPTQADYDALRSTETPYALDRRLLPAPDEVIAIEPGTLVIANASKPHAVSPCAGAGERLSVSGFLGYSGPDAPLRVFS